MSHMASQCKYKYGGALNRFMLFSPNTGEEVTSEEGGDPGIVIFLSEDAMIHDVMQLPRSFLSPQPDIR